MENSVRPIIEALEKSHAHFNSTLFHGALTTVPVITIMTSGRKSAYGWYGPERWQNGTSHPSELNISAEHLKRPVADVLGTLIHEMAHQLSHQLGRKDTSRSGAYHNKRFKDTAEACGLICEAKDKRSGFGITKVGPIALAQIESIRSMVESTLVLCRPPETGKPKQKGKMLLWMCEFCETKIRSGRKDLSIQCNDCVCDFKLMGGDTAESEGGE